MCDACRETGNQERETHSAVGVVSVSTESAPNNDSVTRYAVEQKFLSLRSGGRK